MSGGGKGGEITVGYRYFLGMHMALCHGPIDTITKIEVDGRIAWEGVSTGQSITVDAQDLFGGDKREGGVSGVVDIEFGEATQQPNDYLSSVLPGVNPAYRGVACAVLRQCYMGNNPYLKPWAFTSQRIHVDGDGGEQWNNEKSAIVNIEGDPVYLSELCSGYSCLSFENYIESLGFDFVLAYSDSSEWAWPFETDGGDGAKFRYYQNFIASPVLKSDWDTGLRGVKKADASTWDQASTQLQFCSDLNYVLNTQPFTTGVLAVKPPSNSIGDHSIAMIVSGYDGTETMSGILARATGKPWIYQKKEYGFWSGDIQFNGSDTYFSISSAVGGSGFTEQTLTANWNGSGGPTDSIALGRIGNRWNYVNMTFSSTNPYVVVLGPSGGFIQYDINVFMSLSFTIASAGDSECKSYSLSKVVRIAGGFTNADDPTPYIRNIRYNAATLYNTPSYFYNATLSCVALSVNINAESTPDYQNLCSAFLRNFSNYQTPDYCFCTDMNPAHIIRECLTQSWGLGYQNLDIDDSSFISSATHLQSEGMGISILWDREVPIEDFISEILRHIDAVLYVSRETGKFVLKLIRDDYDVGSLLTLDETNSRMASDARRPTIGELVTSVTVNFTDSEQDEEDGSVTVHNEALIQLQGSVNNATADYPGFMTRSLASRIALRDLKSLSTPLLSCDVEANRDAAELNIGDVFILDYPEQGIFDVVMRIESMSVGDGRDNTVKISCVEDSFSVPDFDIVGDPGPGWVDPVNGTPEESQPRLMIESPYYELVQRVGDREAGLILDDDPDAGFIHANGGRQGGELNADLLVDSGAGFVDSGVLDFAPYAYLSADAWYSDSKLYYINGKDLDTLTFPALAQVGDEIIRVDSLGVDSNGAHFNVGRGVLDTVPAEHTIDLPVVFFAPATDNLQYTASDTAAIKLLTALGSNRLSEDNAPLDIITFDSRAIRPYPPGNFEIDFESYPRTLEWDGMHSLSWAHRDRLQQTSGTIFDNDDGDIGPEPGVDYVVTGTAFVGESTKSALRINGAYSWVEGDISLDLADDDFVIEFSIFFDGRIQDKNHWYIIGQSDISETRSDFAWEIIYTYVAERSDARLLFRSSPNGSAVGTSVISFGPKLKEQEWHNIRLIKKTVYRETGRTIFLFGYLNGEFVDRSSFTSDVYLSSQPLRIGNIGNSSYESWVTAQNINRNDDPWFGYVSNLRITVGESRLPDSVEVTYIPPQTYDVILPFPEIACDSSGVTPCDEYFDSVVTLNTFDGSADNDVISGNTWTLENASIGDTPPSTVELEQVVFLDVNVGTDTEYDIDFGSSEIDSSYAGPPLNTRFVTLSVKSVRDGYDSWQAPSVTLTVPEEIDSIGIDSIGIDSNEDEDVKKFIAEIENTVAGEFDFDSIPSGYKRLIIEGYLRGDVGAVVDVVHGYYNTDLTNGNYHRQAQNAYNGSQATAEDATPRIAEIPAGSSPANAYGQVRFVIENYASSLLKTCEASGVGLLSADGVQRSGFGMVWEASTDPITRIRIRTDNHPTDGLLGKLTLYGEL